MNNVTKITCAVVLIGLVASYGILSGKSNSSTQVAEQFAVLTYYPHLITPYKVENERYSVRIFYGDKVENVKLTKEELAQVPMSSHVAVILSRLSNEGYSLVSTSAVTTGTQVSIDSEVHCFLKKVK